MRPTVANNTSTGALRVASDGHGGTYITGYQLAVASAYAAHQAGLRVAVVERHARCIGASVRTDYVLGIGTVEDRMLILVDIERLMGSEEMQLTETAP